MTHTKSPNFADVSRLLAPRSIAVIGASDQPGNLGGVAIRLSQKFGYPGMLWPINPRRAEVHGIPCHARVADLPAPADLALIATAAESVSGLVRECAEAGIRRGIVWAGGFAEIGEGGLTLQQELIEACRDTGFALVGPNCIGIIDSWTPVTASFASFLTEVDVLVRGDISMISQSGGTATMAQAFAQQAGFGFRYMISSGNEAVLTASDYLHALVEDPHTRVIAAYVEGVKDGDRFLAALAEARAAGKPVVVLKGGETAASARAAVAHTGALAGERRVWDAVLRDAGVIQVRSLEELLDNALFLSSADMKKLPAGTGVAVVTFGGGGGVLAADQAARNGLVMPLLTAGTREALRPLVPPIAAIANPVDLTPQAFNRAEWFARFPRALDVIATDPAIHSVLLQFGPMAQRGMDVARATCAFSRRTRKTVCFAWPLAPPGVVEFLREQGVYVFIEHARAIAVLAQLARRHAVVARGIEGEAVPIAFDWSTHLPERCGRRHRFRTGMPSAARHGGSAGCGGAAGTVRGGGVRGDAGGGLAGRDEGHLAGGHASRRGGAGRPRRRLRCGGARDLSPAHRAGRHRRRCARRHLRAAHGQRWRRGAGIGLPRSGVRADDLLRSRRKSHRAHRRRDTAARAGFRRTGAADDRSPAPCAPRQDDAEASRLPAAGGLHRSSFATRRGRAVAALRPGDQSARVGPTRSPPSMACWSSKNRDLDREHAETNGPERLPIGRAFAVTGALQRNARTKASSRLRV